MELLVKMINIISVINNNQMQEEYFVNNNYLKSTNISFHFFDNTSINLPIPQRYNNFINNYNWKKEAWFIFCHQDWELKTDLEIVLKNLNKNFIYGPVGAKLIVHNEKYSHLPIGYSDDISRDKTRSGKLRTIQNEIEPVDSLDCQCLIVHSSLVKKYNLRFDTSFEWDLYAEDFCLYAQLTNKIPIYAVKIPCIHHSDAGFKELPKSYNNALKVLNKKYPDQIFASTCGIIGGKEVIKMSDKEKMFSFIRYINRNTFLNIKTLKIEY